jgi:RNA polymerase-binding protein DksA
MAAQRSSTAKGKKSAFKRTAAPAKATARKAVAPARPAPKAAKSVPVAVNGKHKPHAVTTPIVAKKVVETKPNRVPSTLTKAELTHFRELLLVKRREILGDVGTMESEAFKAGSNLSNMPMHMADVGTDNFEQEFTLGLIESERKILREIQEALGRIEDGTFGICLGTGKPIPKVRLEAVPWAKFTIEYSRALESGAIRRDGAADEEESAGGEEEEE